VVPFPARSGPCARVVPRSVLPPFQEAQALVATLEQSDAQGGPASRNEGAFAPLTLASKTLPVSGYLLVVDRLPLSFRHLPESLEGLMWGLYVQMPEDRVLRYQQFIPNVPDSRREQSTAVGGTHLIRQEIAHAAIGNGPGERPNLMRQRDDGRFDGRKQDVPGQRVRDLRGCRHAGQVLS